MPDQPQSRAQGAFDEFDDLTNQASRLGMDTPPQGWTLDELRVAVRTARRVSAPVEQATSAPGEKRTLGDRGAAADIQRGASDQDGEGG